MPLLTVPNVPLRTRDIERDVDQLYSYLGGLVDYLYGGENVYLKSETALLTFPGSLTQIFTWPDTGTTTASTYVRIPEDFFPGSPLAFTACIRGVGAGGNAVMEWASLRFRDQAVFTQILAATSFTFTPADDLSFYVSTTVESGDVLIGDIVRFDLRRLGSDAGDTFGTVFYDGSYISYKARLGVYLVGT